MAGPTWLSALPTALVAVFWVVGPGLLVLRACGVRGITAWGLSPLVSTAVVSSSAVLAPLVGVRWGPWVPLGAAVVLALLGGLFRAFVARRPAGSALHRGWRTALRSWTPGRRIRASLARLRAPKGRFAKRPEPMTTAMPQVWRTSAQRAGTDGRRAGVAAAAGVVVAAGLAWWTVVLGFGPVDALSSTYDGVFHYNAVAHILQSGDASSLTLGSLTNPSSAVALYPAGWHDLVSLVAMLSGSGVPVATNLTAWVVAGVVFPLSVAALSRQVMGPSPGAALVAPVLATGFTALPWALMSFGVLWPNLLGVALLPGYLTLLLAVVGVAERSVIGAAGAATTLVLTLPALGLAHPNALFSLAVLGLFPVLWGIGVLARRRLLTRRFWQPVVAVVGVAGIVAAVLWFMTASPLTAGVRSFDWPAFTDVPTAIGQVLFNSSNGRPDLVVLSVLVVIGAVAALRHVATSWLVPAHVASGALYVLAAADDGTTSAALTGAWYNDSYRLAAMVPVTGAVLAVVGLCAVASVVRHVLLRIPPTAALARRRVVAPALAAVLLAVVVATTGGMSVATHADVLAGPYQRPSDAILEPGQREFLDEVGRIVGPDDVVAADPFTGNSLLFPLTGRRVLFPHLIGNWTPEQILLATRFRDVGTDPTICTAAADLGVDWLLTGPITFWPNHGGARWYPGLHDIAPVPGFELVATGGGQELWRLTACAPGAPVTPGAQAFAPPGPDGAPSSPYGG
ncbi:hypothetical protein ND486_06320 [Pseudonocardia sp. DR1-2]|uniref:DUF6541 family protein n=1 Tax=Pseudonocardia sp. DR1-2 TaxID=2951168 RepID=UPI00204440DE|nr:DUF6541 family protein [Pseudonocardia sp. DR1-2]MCM3845809.1 hypothetical protein [Pseudonocardia sp. DR1-2]